MKHDLLILIACARPGHLGTLGQPAQFCAPQHTGQSIAADPNLKLVSEGSPYMRNER
jgi:hypothetical protein